MISLMGSFEMPVLPVDSVKAVPATLMAFHRQLGTSSSSTEPANPARDLLPYCSASSKERVLSEHTVWLLTDLTSGFHDIVNKISTSAGRAILDEYLGPEAEKVLSFWSRDYTVE